MNFDADSYSLLSKLQSRLELSKVIIAQNPFPYIEKQNKEIVRLQKFLHDVEIAISPDVVFDTALAMSIHPNYFQGADLVKVNAVKAAIDKYWSATP